VNIDLNALKAIEEQQGIPMDDLLGTIANALLFSYREFKEGEAEEAAKARVDIDTETGNVAVIVSELNADGEVISEYDDTPVNFSRIGSVAVRDAIKAACARPRPAACTTSTPASRARLFPALCSATPRRNRAA